MTASVAMTTLVVDDYDRAIAFYRDALGLKLVADTDMGGGKRWVVVAPPGATETRVLLAKASTPEQSARVGDQTGGRVFLLLHTDDFWRDYRRMEAAGATFCETPREEAYGTVVVFQDLYGNKWDLLQLNLG